MSEDLGGAGREEGGDWREKEERETNPETIYSNMTKITKH